MAALENWPDLIVESGVHFGKESYVLLVVWIVLGIIFYLKQIKYLRPESSANNHYTKDI